VLFESGEALLRKVHSGTRWRRGCRGLGLCQNRLLPAWRRGLKGVTTVLAGNPMPEIFGPNP
jgi:hypothetical protein